MCIDADPPVASGRLAGGAHEPAVPVIAEATVAAGVVPSIKAVGNGPEGRPSGHRQQKCHVGLEGGRATRGVGVGGENGQHFAKGQCRKIALHNVAPRLGVIGSGAEEAAGLIGPPASGGNLKVDQLVKKTGRKILESLLPAAPQAVHLSAGDGGGVSEGVAPGERFCRHQARHRPAASSQPRE